jgi:BRCA1-associated protein
MYTLLVKKSSSKAKAPSKKENAEAKQEKGGDAGNSTESIAFSAGNPRVEHITGVVHLYRDLSENAVDEATTPSAQQVQALLRLACMTTFKYAKQHPEGSALPHLQAERSTTLCCLSLPGDMSVANFCTFCGAYLAEMAEMRVLRREGSSRSMSMVLLYFKSQEVADSFYDDHSGRPVSALVLHLGW